MQRFPRVNSPFIYVFTFFILNVLFSNSFSEPVAKFAWKGSLTGLADKTLEVPLGTVAMSEYIYVSTVLDNLTEKDPCSIMFIIDNSGSNTQGISNGSASDYYGERFKVVSELVDLIYAKAPETKVGLIFFGSRLWMYGQDDPLFSPLPIDQSNGSGAYIAPLNLDQMYSGRYRTRKPGMGTNTPSEQFNYEKTGLEVLKLYLETVDYQFMSKDPIGQVSRYQPVHMINSPLISHGASNTNITIAFEAAKAAHLNQSPLLNSSRHFNIFFSDGLAGVENENPWKFKEDDYIAGTDVPTTFTIFYNANANDLSDLQSMTNNIKSNGYSSSNDLSNLWDMSDWNDIKTTLEQDVFNKILSKSKGTPTEITIKTESETNWDSTGFKYKDLFPLQKNSTPFDIDLKVHIIRDSLDDKGNIIKSEEKDTNLVVNFDVTVENVTAPDSMEITKWGRDMFLFFQGDTVKQADSQMDNLEVRFEDYKIDTTFGYSEIDAVVKSKTMGDSETLRLNPQGLYFTNNFNIEVQGANITDNGTLSLSPVDSIILIYENPDLPLDTIRKAFYFTDAVEFSITNAAYFDNRANGYVDRVDVEVSGTRVNDYADDIYNAISFASTNISKQSYTLNGNIFKIEVTSSGAIKTVTDNTDIVRVIDTVNLSQGSKILPSQTVAIDSMAPVIIDALFIDSIKESSLDEIQIAFSEDISDAQANNAINFIKQTSNLEFNVSLNHINTNGNNADYFISSISNSQIIEENDSVWINSSSNPTISDNHSNIQDNNENRKCPIRIRTIPDGIIISKASYLDPNADGRIDIIKIEWSDTVETIDENVFLNLISLPSKRSFTIDSSTSTSMFVLLYVTEGSTTTNTAVSIDEEISLNDTIISSQTIKILPSTINVTDSLAPVILTAAFKEGNQGITNDELTVVFSESIEENQYDEPIYFCKSSGSQYHITLSIQSHNDNTTIFNIDNYVDNIEPAYGDSVWINSQANLSDISSEKNKQNNSNNIKRPLSLNLACIMINSTYKEKDDFSDGLIDLIEIEFNEEINEARAVEIIQSLSLPKNRNINIAGPYYYQGKRLTISVVENGIPKTDVDPTKDILTINKTTIDSITIFEHSIPISDGLPPVITEAIFKPGPLTGANNDFSDTLILKFSEEVNIPSTLNPFNFYDIFSGNEYEMDLNCFSNSSSSTLNFIAISKTKEFPQSNDSVWIDYNNLFSDINNIDQNRNNKKVPLKVSPYPYDYEIIVFPNPFTYNKFHTDFRRISDKYMLQEDKDLEKNTIVIMAIPKGRVPLNLEPTGSIELYDVVGNHIATLNNLKFNSESGCIYALWKDPQNNKGRELGSGILVFKYSLSDNNGKSIDLKGSIGIKRKD